mmetsp:Transcript_8672/g.30307  ORF Transcript_8672/g.30307 Transcript_8672/m.30307 type:complete len:331 (+) Transcript_8672:168-1160(+)
MHDLHVLVLLPGAPWHYYSRAYEELKELEKSNTISVTFLGGTEAESGYDRYPAVDHRGLKIRGQATTHDPQHIESFVTDLVVPSIQSLQAEGKYIGLICGSKAGHLALPYLWDLGFNFPAVVFNSMCVLGRPPQQCAPLFLVAMGKDYTFAKNPWNILRFTQRHASRLSWCRILYMPDEGHCPTLPTGLLTDLVLECFKGLDEQLQSSKHQVHWLPIHQSPAQITVLKTRPHAVGICGLFLKLFILMLHSILPSNIWRRMLAGVVTILVKELHDIKGYEYVHTTVTEHHTTTADFLEVVGRKPYTSNEFEVFLTLNCFLHHGTQIRSLLV